MRKEYKNEAYIIIGLICIFFDLIFYIPQGFQTPINIFSALFDIIPFTLLLILGLLLFIKGVDKIRSKNETAFVTDKILSKTVIGIGLTLALVLGLGLLIMMFFLQATFS